MGFKRDEQGMIMPIKTERAPADKVPGIREQYPTTDEQQKNQEPTAANEKPEARKKAIGEEEVIKAKSTLKDYISSKKAYDERFKNNFDTYNLLYLENNQPQMEKGDNGELRKKMIPKRIGGQCLNVIMNKHADAMDNYPEPIFLPRSKDDEHAATMLNSIVPCVLERNRFQRAYADIWTDKLVGGASCYSVTWDNDADYGLGDVRIARCDILSLFWEPFIEDIQESKNFFCVNYFDIEEIRREYPQLKDVSSEDMGIEEYRTYDTENKTHGKAAVIDWYYKRDGLLHFCKFCGKEVLFASENEPDLYPKGFYQHGKYPFVVGALFRLKDTPVGFSFVDICRAPQQYLDELKRDILKNVKVNSGTRQLLNSHAAVNDDDLCDLEKEFIKVDNVPLNDVIRPLETKDIAAGALSIYSALIDEIKETTGTNDASNGASAAGVTSGSAIAALQEAGGKISRDIIKTGGFLEFEEICEMVLELIRQHYDLARCFRIVGEEKKTEYIEFDNSELLPQQTTVEGSDEIFNRLPVFDIKVKTQRSNPFTTAANNQMMIDMFRMGVFAPQNADAALVMLEGMSFEGKDKIVELLKNNQTLEQMVVQLSGRLEMSNAALDMATAQSIAGAGDMPAMGTGAGGQA